MPFLGKILQLIRPTGVHCAPALLGGVQNPRGHTMPSPPEGRWRPGVGVRALDEFGGRAPAVPMNIPVGATELLDRCYGDNWREVR